MCDALRHNSNKHIKKLSAKKITERSSPHAKNENKTDKIKKQGRTRSSG